MTVELTKTTSHTTVVAELASQSVGGEAIFPTYLVTSAGTEIGTAASPVYVSPGTGATWAVTGPLTDTQLRASAVPVSLASIPIATGAATSANQATEIASLASIDGKLTACNTGSVVIASSALPSGAATSANQTTGNTSLASIDGKIPALGQALAAASVPVVLTAAQLSTLTPLSTVAATQSGTWNVTNISGTVSLPTGAATAAKQPAIGTAGSASTDVITVQGIASMTALKVDGSAVTQPVSGTFWQATQPVSIASAVPVTDNAGSLTVDAPVGAPVFVRLSDGASAISTLPVSLASSVTVVGAAASGATKSGNPVQAGAVFNTTQPTVTTGQAVELQATARGGLIVATGTDTFNVTVNAALPSGANAIGKLAANSGVTIGAVEIAASQTLSTLTTCSTVTTLTGGGVAHDSTDSGNPHKIGFKATTSLSGATMVAAGDRTDAMAGVDGAQIVRPHCNLEDIVSGVAAITDGSSTSVIAAQGAGVKVYVTAIAIANSSATAVTVDIRDGSAGTVKMTLPVPASTSGVVLPLPVPLPFSANTAVCADPSAAASTVTVTLVGFKSKI